MTRGAELNREISAPPPLEGHDLPYDERHHASKLVTYITGAVLLSKTLELGFSNVKQSTLLSLG